MEVRYKRDLNSNYMILTEEQPMAESYEIRMITENRIYGFLPCVQQIHESGTEYYFEITGRQSMKLLYERRKMDCAHLKGLLKELERILESAGEYLLNPDHFVLDPEFMYMQAKTEKLCLCYYPGSRKDIREAFLDLAEYLLGRLDKNDTEGIEFGYDLYQRALEPNFSLLELLNSYTETAEEKELSVEAPPMISVQEEILEKTGSWKNFFRKKEKKARLEDYVAEADQMGSGSVLFLREEGKPQQTAWLQPEKREGLRLQSKNPEYPSFDVADDCFLIGKRRESVDGCLPAPTVSRIHARITFDGSLYYVEDLNSTNGTWADMVQLNPYEPVPLADGMRVVFASVEYEVLL
ncbi:MAG: FHA domain-containing protein [Clostridiales bacterium]|nr:FHA domain-containing protein [Clostridiales bacterium]